MSRISGKKAHTENITYILHIYRHSGNRDTDIFSYHTLANSSLFFSKFSKSTHVLSAVHNSVNLEAIAGGPYAIIVSTVHY